MIRLAVISVGFLLLLGAACGIETNQSPNWFYEAWFWGTVGVAIMYVGYNFLPGESVDAEIEVVEKQADGRTNATICHYPVVNPYTRRIKRD